MQRFRFILDNKNHTTKKIYYWTVQNRDSQLIVSIWSALYSLEKNSDSGGAVTTFTNQIQTSTDMLLVDY